MAGRGSKSAQSRTEMERVRLHAARKAWHDGQIRRRVRDNTIASIAGSLIVLAAIGSQVAYAQANPPAPASPEPTVAPSEGPLPTDTTTPDPAPTETPAG
ncbi:hypothetical protein [uncultured Microbacterium sp.]|uniref:hypothetical protein n=1 Tax=uncultured Microbacterium sp. TaxID=191216 RepID=UPI0028D187C6|nr:hypothetical protein [uncultured Microbacterium sp.]